MGLVHEENIAKVPESGHVKIFACWLEVNVQTTGIVRLCAMVVTGSALENAARLIDRCPCRVTLLKHRRH